jgi:branched-chain amino acid transport system substrate-binding protein
MKGNAKHPLVLLVLLALIVPLATTCTKGETACVVRVGAVVSLTGAFGEQGREQLNGYQMAVNQICADEGKAIKIELVWKDDESDPNRAAMAAKGLIEQEGVSILLGATTSTTSIPVAGVAEVYQVPLLIPSATSDLITDQGYNWVFRLPAPSKAFTSQAIDFLRENGNASAKVDTMAIVYEESDFGNATAVAAATQAAKHDIRVVAYEVFERGQDDKMRDMLGQIKAQDPDALFFAINEPGDAATFLRLCNDMGLNPGKYSGGKEGSGGPLFLGGEGGFVDPLFLERAGPLAENVLVITQWDEDVTWGSSRDFVAAYRQTYGLGEGPVPMLSAGAYAAISVAYEAVARAAYKESGLAPNPTSTPGGPTSTIAVAPSTCTPVGGPGERRCPDRSALRDALREMGIETAFETIFGPIQFDGTGQNNHTALITQVQSGSIEIIYPPEQKTGN